MVSVVMMPIRGRRARGTRGIHIFNDYSTSAHIPSNHTKLWLRYKNKIYLYFLTDILQITNKMENTIYPLNVKLSTSPITMSYSRKGQALLTSAVESS